MPDEDPYLMPLGLRLVRAGNAFVQASEKRMRPRGLRWSSFSVLYMLRMFGRLEARTIARLAGVSRQAISLVLATVERDGQVRRGPVDNDRRLVGIDLTATGTTTTDEALRAQQKLSRQWFAVLTSDERAELDRLLEKLLTHQAGASSLDDEHSGRRSTPPEATDPTG